MASIALGSFAANYVAENSSPDDCNMRSVDSTLVFGLVRFVAWPDLMTLPADFVAIAARLCALVSRKPTQASLIPLILDTPREAVFNVLEWLRHAGSVEWSETFSSPAPDPVDKPCRLGGASAPASSSFLGKLWLHLLGNKH